MNIFEQKESNVRSYCRNFPRVFNRAKNSRIYTESGEEYIDFLAGAGALNYGHNNDYIKGKLVEYLMADGMTHGLDMHTKAKEEFITYFVENILKPRNLDYKLQFTGPTGANCVEAALKLARKVKKRSGIFAFMGGFHGLSLGAMSVTSNKWYRRSAGVDLSDVTFFPFPTTTIKNLDTLDYMEKVLEDSHSGIDVPAAIIVETIQAEGGINIADVQWLKDLRAFCTKHDILLICDDIQVGCGRSGNFFSFDRAGIVPDIVTLAKSISGYGLPMSLVLFKPELDVWEPGEHTGTFRGNQLAFIGAKAALEYRESDKLEQQVKEKEALIKEFLEKEIMPINQDLEIRGIGMLWGIDISKISDKKMTKDISARCFEKGLIIEKAGRHSTVVKIMPPLTIPVEDLKKGLQIVKESMQESIKA